MMDSSGRNILGDVSHNGKMAVPGGFNLGSAKGSTTFDSQRLVDGGQGSLGKGKAKVHDLTPPSPPNAKRLSGPGASDDFCQDNAVQKNVETDHSGHSGLSFGLAPGHSNEIEDASTESDEALEENYKNDDLDVTRNLVHMGRGHEGEHDPNVGCCPLKENMVDVGGNLTQELLDSIGLGKPCSCSFCLKAAHMWMDLTCQDTRSRLTELQKSKKRVADQITKINQDCSKISKPTKLEFDLMQHWKLIFVHTQDGLGREIVKTRSDLQARSKMMENCKRELESRSNVLPDNP